MDDDASGGLRSFREFDRSVRRNAPYGTPEGDRERREDSAEYRRMRDALMSTDGSMPERWSGMTREEAVEELRRLGNDARVLGTGPGSTFGQLRSLVAEKHRSSYGFHPAGNRYQEVRRQREQSLEDRFDHTSTDDMETGLDDYYRRRDSETDDAKKARWQQEINDHEIELDRREDEDDYEVAAREERIEILRAEGRAEDRGEDRAAGGMRSQRGNDPWAEGPTPEEERGLDALTKRVGKTPIGKLYDSDEISNRSNRLLDELITENNWDITDDDGADFGKTLDELLPDRGTAGDTRSKFLASVEEDFWDDPSKYMITGPSGPSPYEVWKDRQMDDGLRSQRGDSVYDSLLNPRINPDWDIRDPDDPRDWHESEFHGGSDAVAKISTGNMNIEIIRASEVLEGEEGWMVVGQYRDLDSAFGNRAEDLYDLDTFATPEDAAAHYDGLDRAIDDDIPYEEWVDPDSGDDQNLFSTALNGTDEDQRKWLDTLVTGFYPTGNGRIAAYDESRQSPGFQSRRLGHDIIADIDTRNTEAGRHAESGSTGGKFSDPQGNMPSTTMKSGSSTPGEKYGPGGEFFDALVGSGFAFFGLSAGGREEHSGVSLPPDRVTANLRIEAIETGLSKTNADAYPEEVLKDTLERISRKRYDGLSKSGRKNAGTFAEFKAKDQLRLEQLDLMNGEHWEQFREAAKAAKMPVDVENIRYRLAVAPGDSAQGTNADFPHLRTEDWVDSILGHGKTVHREDPTDPDKPAGPLEITRKIILADLKNVATIGNGWLGAVPPESLRKGAPRTDKTRDMDGAEGGTAKVGMWSLSDYTQKERLGSFAQGDKGGKRHALDEREKQDQVRSALKVYLESNDRNREGIAKATDLDSETRELLQTINTETGEHLAAQGAVKYHLLDFDTLSRNLATGQGMFTDYLDPRRPGGGGLRSQRSDPDDWKEIEEELKTWRAHPGAPSEENPGGTQEYWRQPFPGRENDPGGPQTLGEGNMGFRRDGLYSSRGSNDPYDPRNDPPPMVRAMRSDGTTIDQVDPEWLKRHPEGVQGWLDKHVPDDGPESRYAQDPDNWKETQEEIRDMMDQRIEESLNRMTDEMRQEEFTRGNELEEAGRQALNDIEWAREAGFRSFIDRDFDPERDTDPDLLHHDDPFVRDQKLNEAIFNDRMTPMAFDAVADKYDMDRVEVRRREMEHMSLLSGQERYEAQPDLNRRIFEDRVGFRMTIEEVAEKYDMDRAEVRMREITHAHGRSGQEKFNTQPNLNRRIAESRMRGMSLDEVADRFNMDPEEVRFREVAYLGTSPEMLQYAEDAERDPGGTGGFRSVRAGETLTERLEGRDQRRTEGGDDATEVPEAPAVDTAKVDSLNKQIDALRDGKIKPLFERIDEAQGKDDTKAVHSLRKQVRPLQESEAELREQLGEAMGKGRVASGYRSSRTTDDWDADWREAREEAESTIAGLSEQIGDERGKKKPNKKKINELAQQQLAAIEKARERGLRSSRDGAPWSDPERSAARRAVSQRFWSQGGEITDAERHSIGGGGLQSQREPSRARMRVATTQRSARPLGLASRRGDEADKTMMTLPTLYREDSPRQAGTADGEIWDSLTDDAGVMSPAHAKAFEDAADQLEIELMSGRQDISPRANSFDSGLAGGNATQHQTYADMFGDAVRAEMIRSGHIGKDDPTPPVTEWRLEQIGRGENTGVRTFEQAFQVQLLETTGTVGQRITTKRKLLDSLQVLQQMRRSGNYEALEHLHPEARKRFLDIARSKDQTLPEKIKGVTKTGGKKSTVWGAIAGHDSMDEYKKHVKRRSRKFRQKMPKGEDKGPIRERIGTAILSPGVPAAYIRRQQLAAQRRAAQAGGAGTGGAGPTKSVQPWKKKLSPLEQMELKRAKKKAKKLGRLTSDQRLGRISENRTSGARDVDKPLGGAAATTYFAGTGDDLEQWEKVEGALVVDSTFIDRLARLTRVRRGTATGKDVAKKRQKGKDSPRTRDDIIDASWFHAGHSGLPEMVGPEEIQDVVFEEDPDYPGRFKLREGFKPMLRGLGRDKDGNSREGDVYWEQWTRLVSRFVGGQGGEVHGAGENNAEPPVRVRQPDGSLSDPVSKGFMFGGYGSGPLTFITPETRLVGWGKLAEINDEAESIVGVLSAAGLVDTEAPTSIKHDGDNFSAAVRAALDAAEKATGGRLQVKGRADHREPQDPNNPSKILPTGSGFGIGGSKGSMKPMTAGWRDTEFGSIVDQVLDLHDSGDLDPTQLEAAWDFLGKLPASVQKLDSREDHFLFDTLPFYGYDAVQRHGGVVSLSNRASVMVLDHPVTGEEVTEIIEKLAKEGKLDQARLRELIPSYGSFH